MARFALEVAVKSVVSRADTDEQDPSISNRVLIWKTAPRMMLDAPSGWGWGKSGNAYVQWYQPLDRFENYRTLVNSHLTWMVEMGWIGRFFYVFAWACVLMLCWPMAVKKWFSVSFASWLTFAVGASFSSVAESFWLWVVPVCGLIFVVWYRTLNKQWPDRKMWLSTASCSLLPLGLFLISGIAGQSTPLIVRGAPTKVSVHRVQGIESMATWMGRTFYLIDPDRQVVGEHFGHAIRKHLLSIQSSQVHFVISKTYAGIPNLGSKILIITGKSAMSFPAAELDDISEVIFLNPAGPVSETWNKKALSQKYEVCWGEFHQQQNRQTWETWAKNHNGASFVEAEGASEYIADWIRLIRSP